MNPNSVNNNRTTANFGDMGSAKENNQILANSEFSNFLDSISSSGTEIANRINDCQKHKSEQFSSVFGKRSIELINDLLAQESSSKGNENLSVSSEKLQSQELERIKTEIPKDILTYEKELLEWAQDPTKPSNFKAVIGIDLNGSIIIAEKFSEEHHSKCINDMGLLWDHKTKQVVAFNDKGQQTIDSGQIKGIRAHADSSDKFNSEIAAVEFQDVKIFILSSDMQSKFQELTQNFIKTEALKKSKNQEIHKIVSRASTPEQHGRKNAHVKVSPDHIKQLKIREKFAHSMFSRVKKVEEKRKIELEEKKLRENKIIEKKEANIEQRSYKDKINLKEVETRKVKKRDKKARIENYQKIDKEFELKVHKRKKSIKESS